MTHDGRQSRRGWNNCAQDIDLIITEVIGIKTRNGAPNTFVTADFAGRYITNEEILRGAFDVMMAGADSVPHLEVWILRKVTNEGMQVQGHVGMVPSMATKYGGIRTVVKQLTKQWKF